MAETTTKQQTTEPQAAPAAQPIAKVNPAKEAWENFRDQLNQRADEIGSQLPPNVTRERFLGASLAAVKSNPGILNATPRSLMSALTKAAQDGLLPDGREGIITVFNTTIDGRKEAIAQWNPMMYGIRKRARELDNIIIDAQVVFTGDEFDYQLGDSPFIKHKPKPRTELLDASHGVAVYAIFRQGEQGAILHREVMWKPEVFATMNQSRAKTSLMWTTFWTEGWRKTVGRRGAKSVPVSPQLERLIQRDDENFSFDQTPPQITGPRPTPPSPPPAPEPDPTKAGQKAGDTEPGAAGAAGDFNNDDSGVSQSVDLDAYLTRAGEEIGDLSDEDSVIAKWEELGVEATITANTDEGEGREKLLDQAAAIRNRNLARVNGQGDMLGGDKPFPGDVPLTKAQKIAGTP